VMSRTRGRAGLTIMTGNTVSLPHILCWQESNTGDKRCERAPGWFFIGAIWKFTGRQRRGATRLPVLGVCTPATFVADFTNDGKPLGQHRARLALYVLSSQNFFLPTAITPRVRLSNEHNRT